MTLTLAQALTNMIEAENAASVFYEILMGHTNDPKVRSFFKELSIQEREHAEDVKDLADRVVAGELPVSPELNVQFIEAVPGWVWADGVSLLDALEVAYAAETHAALYYEAMEEACFCESEVGDLFKQRSKVEQQHANFIKELITKLRNS